MNTPHDSAAAGPSRAAVWTGWVLSGLIGAVFLMSGVVKLLGGPELAEGMAHLGLPESMVLPLAIVELACVAVYLIPQTSILGAVLLTGYLGGAICTHWRVGDMFVGPIVIGVLLWLGPFLRDPRLRALLPLRMSSRAVSL
ncbi:MAG: DoxX family protein [Planctomycetaceae bacterium]